jgi:Protein of unknown function (DUF3108)
MPSPSTTPARASGQIPAAVLPLPDAARRRPRRALIVLTLLVLLVHLVLLTAPPLLPQRHTQALTPPLAQSFNTRVVPAALPPRVSPATPPAALRPAQAAAQPRAPAPKPYPEQGQAQAPDPPAPPPEAQALAAPSPVPSVEPLPTPAEPAIAPAQPSLPEPTVPTRDAVTPVHAATPPRSVRLGYTVDSNRFPFSLNSALLWQHDGESYELKLELGALGQRRVQTSRGTLSAQGLAPVRFADKGRSEVAAHFERDKGTVKFSANTPDATLLPGAQDRLSVLVQLASMIGANPKAFPENTTIAIQTVGARDADIWLFGVGHEEALSLPGGELAGLKLMRKPRKEFDQRVEVWLAPALGYLPARIRITDANGTYIDQKWLLTEAAPAAPG